ncbi:LysR family transcriptional regulator [Halalkalibacter akibai]|uniref:Transcriptional regulator n=1 Tax=Halalkalibacter akibai (strain ATCC 43226 / DSM 21942 / CIP 109018 / JCM 9157 / 1139) TaxID=1236973 RepID=W4QZD8_HALA3|nr:LysR family transcriptional regulator [Halalkalibacter akibai]GAE37490.1 transcriptional regulator [Halalkalibacter akibai JCM 9157]
MQLDLYRVFYVTAMEKNFSKAAKKLYITQPSVSHAIKQLEESLGIQLFVRTSKGVTMTHEGETLFGYISPAFGLIDNAERKISEIKSLKCGHVTIGGSDSTCKHFLLPHIQTFQDMFPEIQIKLQHGSTPKILDKLTKGLIDIGVIHLPIDHSQITLTEFLSISSTFIVGEKYKNLANNHLSLEEMLNYPIISFSETSSSRRFLNQLFQKQGLNVKPDIEVGSVELLIECAKIGMGIAFVTKELVLKELSEGELFEVCLNEKIENRKIGLITRKEIPLSVAANKFIKHLVEISH